MHEKITLADFYNNWQQNVQKTIFAKPRYISNPINMKTNIKIAA